MPTTTISTRMLAFAAAGLVAAVTAVAPSAASATTPATVIDCPTPVVPESAGTTPATGTVAGGDSAAGTAPDGTTFAESKRAGMRFLVPADFEVIEPAALVNVDASSLPAALVEMATKQGQTPGALMAQLARQTDLLVFGPPRDGFAPNVNLIPTSAAEPSDAEINAQLGQLGATNVVINRDPLGAIPAVRVSYQLALGTGLAEGRQLFVVTPQSGGVITVTTMDAATSQAIIEQIGTSLVLFDRTTASESCQAVAANKSGFGFAVPGDWEVTDATTLTGVAEADLPAAVVNMAGALGIDPAQLLAGGLEVIASGPTVAGFAPNINVIAQPGAIPTEAIARQQLEAVGATVATIEAASTPLGDVATTSYTLQSNGTVVHGRQVIVPVTAGYTVVTASTTDAASADSLAALVLASLTRL